MTNRKKSSGGRTKASERLRAAGLRPAEAAVLSEATRAELAKDLA